MSDDLVAFIEDRLADDQRKALAATPEHWSVEPWRNDHNVEFLVIADYHQGPPAIALKSEADAAHIARHDPSRVLRRVAADRRLLEAYREAQVWYTANLSAPAGEVQGLWTAVQLLAGVWSEHPDFRPEWSPTDG